MKSITVMKRNAALTISLLRELVIPISASSRLRNDNMSVSCRMESRFVLCDAAQARRADMQPCHRFENIVLFLG
ncbi:hypothetical protein NOF55_05135 [Rhizobiaceae bacterium BDR2-2]|uniref:Uncharacterized protein n=1 Tax=Ectorhizobium quercum TaxID=2965071 RepID=A0AAE3STT1_9HYPH|nr:hypothetical protein [Ectorhizobium quercum]MCX8996485.1 hypothetical protein [Ectorhizobium quercum]